MFCVLFSISNWEKLWSERFPDSNTEDDIPSGTIPADLLWTCRLGNYSAGKIMKISVFITNRSKYVIFFVDIVYLLIFSM